jgi:hypothetical protein
LSVGEWCRSVGGGCKKSAGGGGLYMAKVRGLKNFCER